MSRLSRRSLLSNAGLVATAGLTGCLDLESEEETTRLCEAIIINTERVHVNGEESYYTELQLLDGDDVIKEKEGDLDPDDGLGITAEDIDSFEGEFLTRARIDGGEWVEVDLVAREANPVGASGTIYDDGISWFFPVDDLTDCNHIPSDEL